jgi:hypothetical protein
MNTDNVRATVYLQVAPELATYLSESHPNYISGAKIVNSTQSRSKKPRAGTVEVKLTIEIPKAAFLPLRPEAIVVVPEALTAPHPIRVEAADANGEDA